MPETIYASARAEGAALLTSIGFTEDGDRWRGTLGNIEGRPVLVIVQLPNSFPDALPHIFINRDEIGSQIAHVEQSGKVCVAPTSGVLIDTASPTKVIQETLERARKILADGIAGRSKLDLHTEFLAYWSPDTTRMLSICKPTGPARQIKLCDIDPERGRIPKKRTILASDRLADARNWLLPLHGEMTDHRNAFLLPLESSFCPPNFGEGMTVANLMRIIREHSSSQHLAALSSWLKRVNLPVTLLLCLPLPEPQGNVLIGVTLGPAGQQARKARFSGFRPGRFTAAAEIQFTSNDSVGRLTMDRFDAPYLVTRGGGSVGLIEHKVGLVGCGAVGSHLALHLIGAGIGELRLIDPESFEAENCHRHILGVKHVGQNKAIALAEVLTEKHPHQTVVGRGKKIQDVLEEEQSFITDVSIVVIAVGDETLERRLNEILPSVPRVHAWLDPLGLGGHVLGTSLTKQPGCYACLFKKDDDLGLYNAASFARAGQTFQRSLAGCAGTFTPYGNLDADRTALEAARLVMDILLRRRTAHVLLSWMGETKSFRDNGFELSARASIFRPGDCREEHNFADNRCYLCGTEKVL